MTTVVTVLMVSFSVVAGNTTQYTQNIEHGDSLHEYGSMHANENVVNRG